MPFEVQLEDARLRAALAAAPERIAAANERAVTGITLDMEGAVVAHTPVGATGVARQAITHQFSGSGVVLQGRVFSTDHPVKTASLEEGRRPGKLPPQAPIELWAVRKLGVGEKDLRSVVYLIRRAIGRRGTQGAHMFRKGFDAALPAATRRVEAWRREIRDVL